MKILRMTSLFSVLMLTTSRLFADFATPFCDTSVGSTVTGGAYLVTLPGENAVKYGLCAQPDCIGLKHLYLVSIPPQIEVRDLTGKLCKITAKAIAHKQGDKQFKRFDVTKIEPWNSNDNKNQTIPLLGTNTLSILFLGTVISTNDTFSLVTVRVDKKIEGNFSDKTFTIRIQELATSGLEVEQQYKIEALLDDAHQFIPFRWTKQQAPNKPIGGDGKPAPQP